MDTFKTEVLKNARRDFIALTLQTELPKGYEICYSFDSPVVTLIHTKTKKKMITTLFQLELIKNVIEIFGK